VWIGAGNACGIEGENGCEKLAGFFVQSASVQSFVRGQNIADLSTHLHGRMERGGRFLKDQADSAAANFPQVLRRSLEQVPPLEKDCTLLDFSVRWQMAQESRGQRAFARRGFTQNAQDFAGADIKIDAYKGRADFARAGGVRGVEILDFKKKRHAWTIGEALPATIHGLLSTPGEQDGRNSVRRNVIDE